MEALFGARSGLYGSNSNSLCPPSAVIVLLVAKLVSNSVQIKLFRLMQLFFEFNQLVDDGEVNEIPGVMGMGRMDGMDLVLALVSLCPDK